MHSHDPAVVWYKQVTPSQMFSDYCLMILQIIITEHLWGTSCACIKRPQDHSCACPRCDFLMDVQRYCLQGHETVTTEHLLMESPDCTKQPQGHGSVCSSDVQVCHQRLSSAFDLLLIFLCSLIQTLTLTPLTTLNPNSAPCEELVVSRF